MAFWETQSLIIWWRVKRVTPEITGREARCLPGTTWAPHLTTEATQQIRFHTHILGSLSSDVFEPRTSSRSGLFALLNRQFEQMFGQILSIRVKLRSNAILVPWRYIKRGTGSLPVDVRRSRTSLLKLHILENIPLLSVVKCETEKWSRVTWLI